MRDEVVTLFVAGHETTAVAMSWILYLLAQHPEVAKKIRDEAEQVAGERPLRSEDVHQLKYTRWVVDEGLRLYPPAWVIGRKPLEDIELDGFLIPKGANILMVTYVIHRDPEYWDEPDQFIPERFSPENESGREKYCYFPFGGGPRLCIGYQFALYEMQILLATLARKYSFALAPGFQPVMDPLITLRPKGGMKMIIQPVSA